MILPLSSQNQNLILFYSWSFWWTVLATSDVKMCWVVARAIYKSGEKNANQYGNRSEVFITTLVKAGYHQRCTLVIWLWHGPQVLPWELPTPLKRRNAITALSTSYDARNRKLWRRIYVPIMYLRGTLPHLLAPPPSKNPRTPYPLQC